MLMLDTLRECAGAWAGRSLLYLPPDPPRECDSEAIVTPILGGRFVRLDYTWAFDGAAQEGTLLIGYEARHSRFTAIWGDTWHMSDALMVSRGEASEGPALSVFGTYAVEGWPDWGWRIVLEPRDDGSLQMLMYNVSPEGEADLAVDATYTPAA
jgi:hypothetical protein